MARLISFLSTLTRACACLSRACLSEYSKRDVYNLIYASVCVFGVYRGRPGVCTDGVSDCCLCEVWRTFILLMSVIMMSNCYCEMSTCICIKILLITRLYFKTSLSHYGSMFQASLILSNVF